MPNFKRSKTLFTGVLLISIPKTQTANIARSLKKNKKYKQSKKLKGGQASLYTKH